MDSDVTGVRRVVMAKLLLIEDEENLLNSLSFILENHGYSVARAQSGEQGVALAAEHHPDLALVDIGLPGIDGFEVSRRLAGLRRAGMMLVFLTGRDDDDDIVRAFAGLADDYVVKPVRPRVLIARLGALLSRGAAGAAPSRESTLVCGLLSIDPERREVTLADEPLRLTPTEFRVLWLLARNANKVLVRADIIRSVHGDDCHLTERSVDFQIHSLRHKFKEHADLLVTVRGFGFKLCA